MENYKKSLVEFVSNLTLEYKENPSVVPYSPSKHTVCTPEAYGIERIAPHTAGIPCEVLTSLLHELEADGASNVHSIVITKGGKIVSEASRPGFSPRLPHLSHSMAKSIVGILIMMLWDDGKIDTGAFVTSFFPEITPRCEDFKRLTVEHLLSMSSGVGFGESGVVCEAEWTRAYFDSDMTFSPGERFAYNSMNSYILSHIAERICQKEYSTDAEAFLYERLFAPLAIPRPIIEKSSEGVIKGGFGMYLSAESWAKLGIMMLNGGTYGGRRILSRAAVVMMSSPQSITKPETGDFNYGLHLWVNKDGDDFLFNGMFGQNVWICPKREIVAVMTAGNNELFSKGAALSTVRKHLSSFEESFKRPGRKAYAEFKEAENRFFEARRWITPPARQKGVLRLFSFVKKPTLPDVFQPILGDYLFPKNNVGIFPVFVRTMQNNFQGGIRKIKLEKNKNLLRLTSYEGEHSLVFDFGFYEPYNGVIDLCGEKYLFTSLASALETDSGELIYKLELIFPELPNTRRITLSLSPLGRLTVAMREIPDERIADAMIDAIPTLSGRVGILYSLLERNLGKNFIKNKVEELFSPTLTAISENAPDAEAALAELEKNIEERISSSRLVRSLVFNFLGNEEKKAETPSSALGRIAGFIGKFFD